MGSALFIDDDVELLESMARMARLEGLELETASSWDEGLISFHVTAPNLVIADYNMPGSRHGLQLMAEIRQTEPEVRLILISGYLDEEDMDAVTKLGVVDLALVKGPSSMQERLLAEIRAAAENPDEATWPEMAEAHVKAAKISEEAMNKLDVILTKKATH